MNSIDQNYIYKIEYDESCPQLKQSEKIIIPLKPHQSAALHKAVLFEKYGKVNYNISSSEIVNYTNTRHFPTICGNFSIKTNIGILGDIVGYGKTLTALSIIATMPSNEIKKTNMITYSYSNKNSNYANYANFSAKCLKKNNMNPESIINTTLVIVPRGPVFIQWLDTIKNYTTLKCLQIDSIITIRKHFPSAGSTFKTLKEFFEKYDIVLIKSTMLNIFLTTYHLSDTTVFGWDRIMIDEAPDIISKIPIFNFKFLWLISGTYSLLIERAYNSRTNMMIAFRDIISETRLPLLLIKGNREFVEKSFNVPPAITYQYICHLPRRIAIVHPFLNPHVQERINANDYKGAIHEMGGLNENEDDMIELVTKEIKRDICNKEKELVYFTTLDLPEDQKKVRLESLNKDLEKLNEKFKNLLERISNLSQKQCPICYEDFSNPVVLQCSHVVCGNCLLNWMKNGHVCPVCRFDIASNKLIAIVDEKEDENIIKNNEENNIKIKSKEDTIIDIINNNPNGKFLIFSRIDNTFLSLIEKLHNNNITFADIKGSTSAMMNILERFKTGSLKVIMLNTYHAGSGIDISFATDVIIFHSMGLDKTQAIGRAQRVGRTSTLNIHELFYPHEIVN